MLAIGVWQVTGESDPGAFRGPAAKGIVATLANADPAGDPFFEYTATSVEVGSVQLEVVLADEPVERSQGLRYRESAGAYDGMLFVYPELVGTSFTMSAVQAPLDIGFYDPAGRVVARLRMKPCAGTYDECPLYSAGEDFQYALETPAGELPEGRLRGL